MAQTEVEGSKVSTKKSGKRKAKESSDEEEVPTVKPPKKKRATKEYKSKEFIESEDETPAPPSNLPAKTAGDSNDGVAKTNAPAKPVKQTTRMTATPHVAPKAKGKGKAKATAKGKATAKVKAKVMVSQKDMWKRRPPTCLTSCGHMQQIRSSLALAARRKSGHASSTPPTSVAASNV
ncbi:hypothetical protein SCP_1001530 [Sparassis crispa]|uniref:Uncharacterized protein n=1 Tax=Sparassis crispa TaxID=139825 RepID=A0A401GXM3_9APHY|nr:hypothetical protein SCP_1001530 [Sparassis crispa]GBE86909.1 hypothetical protein SCP_1001530 [Sparassis crispa]